MSERLTKEQVLEAIKTINKSLMVEDLLNHYEYRYGEPKNDELKMHCIDIAHNDSNPSMNFHIHKKVYNCLSCEAKGNWYTFVTNAEQKINDRKMSMMDKLQLGASLANIELEGIFVPNAYEESLKGLDYEISEVPDGISKQMETFGDDVLKQFHKKSSNYFIMRGYESETVKTFEMGFGVKGRSKDRCIFPVRNIKGELLGWSGRSVINNPQIKWLHEPQDRFFKGLTLFNIDKAFPYIAETGEVYVYESIGNCMRAWELGYKNCVALLGNKMTKEQADMLCDIANKVYVCGDPDMGGYEMNLLAINLMYGRVELLLAYTNFGLGEDNKPLDYGDVGKAEFDSILYLEVDEFNDKMEEVFLSMLSAEFEKDTKIKLPNGKEVLLVNELKKSVDSPQLIPDDILFIKSIDNLFGVKKVVAL